MKADIHPKYYPKAKVTCACGTVHEMGSTKDGYRVDICAACHPFYTGTQKLVDTAGRVDKFMARQKVAQARMAETQARNEKKAKEQTESLEEKLTRKAIEKDEAKEAEKAEMEMKKEAAKKTAAKKRGDTAAKKAPAKAEASDKKPAAKKATAKKK